MSFDCEHNLSYLGPVPLGGELQRVYDDDEVSSLIIVLGKHTGQNQTRSKRFTRFLKRKGISMLKATG